MKIYPHAPGHKGTAETSVQAAAAVKSKAQTQRDEILKAFAKASMTHDECAAATRPEGMDDVLFETFKRGVRSRCSELKAQNKISATKIRRKNDSGHPAVVWRLAQAVPVVSVAATAKSTTTSTRAVQQQLI